ncbi:hypothetical protein J4E91_002716 [Alternaria rosae]|nr:hypothetical protein J4E91_002716 [Alternaria rosae]
MEKPEKEYMMNRADTITQRNQLESPLLGLPVEIRNKIYDYVFSVGSVHFGLSLHHYRTSETDYEPQGCEPTDLLDVASTCRQIHSDTSTLSFKNNVIILDDKKLFKMVGQLEPHQLEAIKALEIVFYDQRGYFPNWISVSRTLAKKFKASRGSREYALGSSVGSRMMRYSSASAKNFAIQVTCVSKHEDNDEGKTVPDEEETTPDEEAEPGDEKLGDDDDGSPSTRSKSSDTKTATEEDNPMEK